MIKHDSNKPRWDLLPWKQVEQIVEVLTLGSEEYGDFNWQTLPNPRRRYFAATLRHLISWFTGTPLDHKTNKSHLAHAAANVLFLMWFESKEIPNEPLDKLLSDDDRDSLARLGVLLDDEGAVPLTS